MLISQSVGTKSCKIVIDGYAYVLDLINAIVTLQKKFKLHKIFYNKCFFNSSFSLSFHMLIKLHFLAHLSYALCSIVYYFSIKSIHYSFADLWFKICPISMDIRFIWTFQDFSYYILSLVITFQVIVSLMVIFISTVCKSWHLISRVENKGISDQSKSVYVKTGPESFIIVAKAHHLKLSFLALYLRN